MAAHSRIPSPTPAARRSRSGCRAARAAVEHRDRCDRNADRAGARRSWRRDACVLARRALDRVWPLHRIPAFLRRRSVQRRCAATAAARSSSSRPIRWRSDGSVGVARRQRPGVDRVGIFRRGRSAHSPAGTRQLWLEQLDTTTGALYEGDPSSRTKATSPCCTGRSRSRTDRIIAPPSREGERQRAVTEVRRAEVLADNPALAGRIDGEATWVHCASSPPWSSIARDSERSARRIERCGEHGLVAAGERGRHRRRSELSDNSRAMIRWPARSIVDGVSGIALHVYAGSIGRVPMTACSPPALRCPPMEDTGLSTAAAQGAPVIVSRRRFGEGRC